MTQPITVPALARQRIDAMLAAHQQALQQMAETQANEANVRLSDIAVALGIEDLSPYRYDPAQGAFVPQEDAPAANRAERRRNGKAPEETGDSAATKKAKAMLPGLKNLEVQEVLK